MRYSNIKRFAAIVLASVTLLSCAREGVDIEAISDIKIKISFPEEHFENTNYSNRTIKMIGEYTYEATTDENGLVVFNDVIPGIYNISVTETLSKDEYDNMKNPPIDNRKILINGVLPDIRAYEPLSEEIALNMGVERDIIISKIYYSQCKDNNNKTYMVDNYIELYNNADKAVEVKDLYVGLVETESSAWFYESRYEFLALKDVYRLNDTIIESGESIVMARQAINHKEFAANSVDLSGADYETKSSRNQVWNSEVPLLPNAYRAVATLDYLFLMFSGGNQIVLFNYDGDDIKELGLIQKPDAKPTHPYYLKIRPDMILDGVECLKYNATQIDLSKKRFPEEIDATYVTLTTSSGRNNQAVERRVERWEAGRAILKDTNNSIDDFVTTSNPESRNYSKPELQPQN